jgi:rubrerythrin
MANVISAQKAEDGKISWVEFTPPYHAHLVKCTVALVPRPLQKVKKVMFAYVLETLNGEAPKAFFDLTKGPSLAAKAQKEKKRLARKRNRASRRERRRVAKEAAGGQSQWTCEKCGRKFGSRKAQK